MKPVYFTIISGSKHFPVVLEDTAAAAAAKSLQSCPTWCDSGQQPTRLLCAQDSLGKNTGVGCHFLLHLRILSVIKFDNFAKIYLIFDHSWSILICSLSEIILSLSLISFLTLISFHWFIFIVSPFLILFFFAYLILFLLASLSWYICLEVLIQSVILQFSFTPVVFLWKVIWGDVYQLKCYDLYFLFFFLK